MKYLTKLKTPYLCEMDEDAFCPHAGVIRHFGRLRKRQCTRLRNTARKCGSEPEISAE